MDNKLREIFRPPEYPDKKIITVAVILLILILALWMLHFYPLLIAL